MAEEKKEEGFKLSDFFEGVAGFVGNVYGLVETFVDKTGPPGIGFQFTPYYVAGVFVVFFFAWIPLHPHATAIWSQLFMGLLPFVLPFLLLSLTNIALRDYGWLNDYERRDYCVLEIKLPDEITQSPYAMELVLRGIYQTGEINTWWDEFRGVTKPWFSLEIVSTEGRVRFFMWGRRSYKELMENQIYAHYPTVQVVEAEDYTLQVPYDPATIDLWGVEQALQLPDPYPILTYGEIQTLKSGEKEEFKHDPLAAVIESMGSIGEGEHLWTQFIIRAHEKGRPCPYAIERHHEWDLETWAQKEIDAIVKSAADQAGRFNFNALTQGDKDKVQAIQYKLNKQPFEVGIRSMYIARKDKYRGAPRTGMPSAFRSFEHGSSGRGLNGLRPDFWIGPFNYPWQDFQGIRQRMLRSRYYNAFITRQYFFPPHRHRWIVLNSEELATIYHFPGRVVATPNLERVPSRRAAAPANLPI